MMILLGEAVTNMLAAKIACRTLERSIGKGINAEFPSNTPNRIKRLFPCCSLRYLTKPSDLPEFFVLITTTGH